MTDNANIENLFYLLASLDVEYTLYEHRPLFRVADGEEIEQKMPGAHCRNLFLRDKKKNNFLFTAMNETPIDLKAAQKALGCGRLS